MTSGVSLFDGRPFCHIRWGAEGGQLTPDELRQHGLYALEVAEAAEQDAAMVAMLREMGMADQHVGAFIEGIRRKRAAWVT